MPKGVYLRTERHRQENRSRWTPERRAEASARNRGRRSDGQPVQGSFISPRGYRILTGYQGHPLADGSGGLAEHRKVLYDEIGPGPHPCHWCAKEVVWGDPSRSRVLCVDHVDEDTVNNDPDNLVPSCFKCNWDRGRSSHRAGVEGRRQ